LNKPRTMPLMSYVGHICVFKQKFAHETVYRGNLGKPVKGTLNSN